MPSIEKSWTIPNLLAQLVKLTSVSSTYIEASALLLKMDVGVAQGVPSPEY